MLARKSTLTYKIQTCELCDIYNYDIMYIIVFLIEICSSLLLDLLLVHTAGIILVQA